MGCGTTLVKCILIIANVLFALAGLGLTGIGAAALTFLNQTLATHHADAVSIAAIATGAVTFVVAFFGCCGAIFGSKGILATYSVVLIILMNLKTALATALLVGANSFTDAMKRELQTVFYNDKLFTDIESTLECCGTTGANAYSHKQLPTSCCTSVRCTEDNSHFGCFDAVEQMVRVFCVGVSGLCVVLVVVELLAVVLSLGLANHVNKKYKGRY